MDEGYIKYQCKWTRSDPISTEFLNEINRVRQALFDRNWIGEYPESKIGFGNLSVRFPENEQYFIISGTQTGGLNQLGPDHYALVTAWNLDKNVVHCEGPLKASSEALTHAGIYALSPEIKSVIHIHHAVLWDKMKKVAPTTPSGVGYGTVAMAKWMKKLFENSNLSETKFLVMGGHEEGLISFGKTCQEAFEVLVGIFEKNNL